MLENFNQEAEEDDIFHLFLCNVCNLRAPVFLDLHASEMESHNLPVVPNTNTFVL